MKHIPLIILLSVILFSCNESGINDPSDSLENIPLLKLKISDEDLILKIKLILVKSELQEQVRVIIPNGHII